MKTYAIYYTENNKKWNSETNQLDTVNPYPIEMCGTDSVKSLDRRLTLHNQIKQAETFKPSKAIGFKIVDCLHLRELNKGKIKYSTID